MTSRQTKLDDLVQQAIDAIRDMQSRTPEDRSSWIKSLGGLPPMIPLGDGRQILTSRPGLTALHEFGRRWRREDPTIRGALSEEVAAQLAVRVFGHILDGADIAAYPDDAPLKAVLKEKLSRRLEAIGLPITHYLPCHLFEQASVKSIEVGPVCFLDREKWLDAVERRAGGNLVWIGAVRDHWAGRKDARIVLGNVMPNAAPEDWTANDVVKNLAGCRWVAAVEVQGREVERSSECAAIAVRAAIETIVLPLSDVDAKLFRGPGDNIQPQLSQPMRQVGGSGLLMPSRIDMPGFRGGSDQADEIIGSTDVLRRSAGKAIRCFIDLTRSQPREGLSRRWVEGLYWYSQARRGEDEFIDLVHVGIALDVLTQGKEEAGIIRMCCDLFGITGDTVVTSSGQSLKRLVELIYKEGRSQIGHGGRLALLEDLPVGRETALQFASIVLTTYVERLDHYDGEDNVKSFLAALPLLRSGSVN